LLIAAGILSFDRKPPVEPKLAPVEPELDLSSRLATSKVILQALEHSDMETFLKCVSSRINNQVSERKMVHEWFALWQRDVAGTSLTPLEFSRRVQWRMEKREWRLDEI